MNKIDNKKFYEIIKQQRFLELQHELEDITKEIESVRENRKDLINNYEISSELVKEVIDNEKKILQLHTIFEVKTREMSQIYNEEDVAFR